LLEIAGLLIKRIEKAKLLNEIPPMIGNILLKCRKPIPFYCLSFETVENLRVKSLFGETLIGFE